MNKLLPILLVVILGGCGNADKVETGLELLCTEEKRTEPLPSVSSHDYDTIACYENFVPSGKYAMQFLSDNSRVMITDSYFGKQYHGYEATPGWIYIKNLDGEIAEKINRITGESQNYKLYRRCPTKCEISPGAFSSIQKIYETKEKIREKKREELEIYVEEETEDADSIREKRIF